MKLHSIFQSINGEVNAYGQGSICTFIRLQGCNLRCKWCDTPDAIGSANIKKVLDVSDIVHEIKNLPVKTKIVTITGGEPCLQMEELIKLSRALIKESYKVSVETNGSFFLKFLPFETSCVMDYKPFSSGTFCDHVSYYGAAYENATKVLKSSDWIKFPVQNWDQFTDCLSFKKFVESDWKMQKTNSTPSIAFSAVWPLTPEKLYKWIMGRKIKNVVLNVQIHKLIGIA